MHAWNFFLLWDFYFLGDNLKVTTINGERDSNLSSPSKGEQAMPPIRNLNTGSQYAVKIDRVSASYKLCSHRDHIDSTNILCLWKNNTINVIVWDDL